MDFQLLQALQHDIDRAERLEHDIYAQVLISLQRELAEQWTERNWSPIENIHRKHAALNKQPQRLEFTQSTHASELEPRGVREQQITKTIQQRGATSDRRKRELIRRGEETSDNNKSAYGGKSDPMKDYTLVTAGSGQIRFDEQHPRIRLRILAQYTKHFSPGDLHPVVIETAPQGSLVPITASGMVASLAAMSVIFLPGILANMAVLVCYAALATCLIAIHQHSKSKPPAITTSKHIHELESSFSKQEPLEVVRRGAAHALCRSHQERVDYTQYAVLVDNPGKMTRVVLMSYRPSTSGYTTRLVQQRRFGGDDLITAAECKGFLENRAAKYEEDAREQYEKTVETVEAGLGKKQLALEQARERKETAKQLAVALDGYDRKVV